MIFRSFFQGRGYPFGPLALMIREAVSQRKSLKIVFSKERARMDIAYDRYSLIINGRRVFVRSGAMHYFRLPSEKLWRDRLFKLKAAGYNTVDLYFCWAYHSPEPGVYDFTGVRDIRRLLKIVEEMGLYLIARPGPYINAEYTAGGLPGWLLAKDDVRLRNRREDGSYERCELYMAYVREWWEQILPIILECPSLILMQIENEYATSEVEPDYIQELYDMTRELGVTVPLFHNDLYAAGLYEDVVDIYAFDNYSVTSFETNWRELNGVFSILDNVETNFRPFCENRPLFVAELQAGWFGTWLGYGYDLIVEHLGREHIGLTTKTLVGQGLTLFNHYKAIGGTNWDYTGSTDTYTSYDFGAPINEAGVNTERLYEAKAINLFLESFGLEATDRVESPKIIAEPAEYLYMVRQNANRPEEQWIFLRNLTGNPAQVMLDTDLVVSLHPHECLILPRNVDLKSGDRLLLASAEPIYQNENILVFRGNRPARIEIETSRQDVKFLRHDVPYDLQMEGHRVILTVDAHDAHEETIVHLGEQTVFILGTERIDHLWVEEDDTLFVGADVRLSDGHYGLRNPLNPLLIIRPDGTLEPGKNPKAYSEPEIPRLTRWKAENLAPALTHNHEFFKVSDRGADFDTNGFYEGSAWYRYHIHGKPETITIDARHIWGAFLNGKLLAEGHHLTLIHGDPPSIPVTVKVPAELLVRDAPDEPAELVIFVDGLGHPKGFHDDARTPQGLLKLAIDDQDVTTDVYYSVGFSSYALTEHGPKQSPVVRLSTDFLLDLPENLHCPLGVQLASLDYERINLYLNGILIGRYWRKCQAQSLYYLPEGILQTTGEKKNCLELILMNFSPMINLKACIPEDDQVVLKPYGVFTKTRR